MAGIKPPADAKLNFCRPCHNVTWLDFILLGSFPLAFLRYNFDYCQCHYMGSHKVGRRLGCTKDEVPTQRKFPTRCRLWVKWSMESTSCVDTLVVMHKPIREPSTSEGCVFPKNLLHLSLKSLITSRVKMSIRLLVETIEWIFEMNGYQLYCMDLKYIFGGR